MRLCWYLGLHFQSNFIESVAAFDDHPVLAGLGEGAHHILDRPGRKQHSANLYQIVGPSQQAADRLPQQQSFRLYSLFSSLCRMIGPQEK